MTIPDQDIDPDALLDIIFDQMMSAVREQRYTDALALIVRAKAIMSQIMVEGHNIKDMRH